MPNHQSTTQLSTFGVPYEMKKRNLPERRYPRRSETLLPALINSLPSQIQVPAGIKWNPLSNHQMDCPMGYVPQWPCSLQTGRSLLPVSRVLQAFGPPDNNQLPAASKNLLIIPRAIRPQDHPLELLRRTPCNLHT